MMRVAIARGRMPLVEPGRVVLVGRPSAMIALVESGSPDHLRGWPSLSVIVIRDQPSLVLQLAAGTSVGIDGLVDGRMDCAKHARQVAFALADVFSSAVCCDHRIVAGWCEAIRTVRGGRFDTAVIALAPLRSDAHQFARTPRDGGSTTHHVSCRSDPSSSADPSAEGRRDGAR